MLFVLCVRVQVYAHTMFMQYGLVFVASGTDTAVQKGEEQEGEEKGGVMALSCTTVSSYYCPQKNKIKQKMGQWRESSVKGV